MKTTRIPDRIRLNIAFLFKFLRLPHIAKYLLFFLFLKDTNIKAVAKINLSNARVELDLGEFIEYWIFMDGLYEKDWVQKTQPYVDGKVFIDIGTNVGIYPLALFRSAKYIYAFEPATESYKKLIRNLRRNSIRNVKVVKTAISSRNKKRVKLYLNKDDKGQNSLFISQSPKHELVRTMALDSFLQKHKLSNIGLLKVDVEGAELEVLKGARKTLQKLHPPFLIELNRTVARLSGHDVSKIYQLMTDSGYQAYRLKRGSLTGLSQTSLDGINNENVLFLHRSDKNRDS